MTDVTLTIGAPAHGGHCVVRHEAVDGDLEVQARVGAENCPEFAITVE